MSAADLIDMAAWRDRWRGPAAKARTSVLADTGDDMDEMTAGELLEMARDNAAAWPGADPSRSCSSWRRSRSATI